MVLKQQNIQTISKILLYPFAVLFGFITGLRNSLYDRKIVKSVRFDFPIISVGNLTAGGTGKTPHVEYLIWLLQYIYKVGTLSRGYRRSTHGLFIADYRSTAIQIGDEPRQFKAKFPDTVVSVAEDRILAIPKILAAHPETDVLLLDDAFQHRSIRAGLSILLTTYNNLFTRDELIPIGWLRESKNGYHRADIIIVSKCPSGLPEEEKEKIIAEIKPYRYQKIYFSTIQYGPLYSFNNPQVRRELTRDTEVLLFCGIAKYDELQAYLQSKAKKVYVQPYGDHHRFDRYDIEAVKETYNSLEGNKILITTEKDAARLEEHQNWFLQNKIEIFVQPVRVQFLFDHGEKFNADILHYMDVNKQKINNNGHE